MVVNASWRPQAEVVAVLLAGEGGPGSAQLGP